jgi:hypothetical protein
MNCIAVNSIAESTAYRALPERGKFLLAIIAKI